MTRHARRCEIEKIVVLASGGYPLDFQKGFPIIGINPASHPANVSIVHAGTTLAAGQVVTNGGRVLSVVARAPKLEDAIADAYSSVDLIEYTGMYFRCDIAHKALR